MADSVERVSPLDAVAIPGAYGSNIEIPPVELSERLVSSLVQISAWPDTVKKVETALAKITGTKIAHGQVANTKGEMVVMPTGPGRWLVESTHENFEESLRELIAADVGSVTGLTHGRVILTVTGEKSTWLLASGIALDFHLDAFPVGEVRQTHHHEIGLTIHRTGEHAFELYLFTSFARAFWEWITIAAGEVGYRVS